MKFKSVRYLSLIMIATIIYMCGYAQGKTLNYFLPEGNYNKRIPTPKDYFGFDVGEWHLEPAQINSYMKTLADLSERIEYYEYARSHEFRPLFVLFISHPDHIRNKEKIKNQHAELMHMPNKYSNISQDLPAVLYQAYSIHGNEPSGVNASVLVAYYLAAAEGPEVESTLKNLFILLDPCLNPDGTQRFATWVNSHKHKNLVSDPADREFNEIWPGGRYNHYWFEMNRDWLPLVHPESKGRIRLFQQWRPNVLTDHHEMGTNSTFFFQPGIPSSTNPNTPDINQQLTEQMGVYHAKALDSIGSRYYTKASFDDFYYGKGSTYPDAQGAVGILFEQASSRGHIQESVNGLLSFAFTIRNQVVTSFSTHKAIVNLRDKLLEFKRDFLKTAYNNLGKKSDKSFIFTHEDDRLLNKFLQLLDSHDIEVWQTDKPNSVEGITFPARRSFVVPVRQKQPVLALTMFEHVSSFQDSSFYDVSGWTPAAAYNLEYTEYSDSIPSLKYSYNIKDFIHSGLDGNAENTYGYMIDIRQSGAYSLLYSLQKKGIMVQTIHAQMTINVSGKIITYSPGSFFISAVQPGTEPDKLHKELEKLSVTHEVKVQTIYSGNITELITAGHPKVMTTEMPKAAVLTGRGISPQSAGEIWHHMDLELGMEITKLDSDRLGQAKLSRYNTLIMPDGNYTFSEAETSKIREWLRGGNRLILIGRAVTWAVNQKLIALTEKKTSHPEVTGSDQKYNNMGAIAGARVLGGSILHAVIDNSHPLFFGYPGNKLAFMHSGVRFYEPTENKFATPAKYHSEYLISGYIPRHVSNVIGGSSVVTLHNSGGGKVIALQDNPLFRGYWKGGQRLFNNAIFLASGIDNNSLQGE